MEIEIKKENHTYKIYLLPKRMRRMILRYRDGNFNLSAPQHMSIEEIKQWLNNLDEEAFEKLKAHYKIKQGDDFVYLFGKKYELMHRPMHTHCVVLKKDNIAIYDDQKEAALEEFLHQQLSNYLKTRLNYFYQMGYIHFIPSFKIQKLRSRYGACFYQNKLLKFAFMLVHEKKEVIDSIIIHEIGHFYYPNHSSSFYKWVKEHDPNFEMTNMILKNGGAGDDSID